MLHVRHNSLAVRAARLVGFAPRGIAAPAVLRLGRHRTHDVAYLDRMPAGIPGEINRTLNHTATIEQIDVSNAPDEFGLVVKLASGKIRTLEAGDAATALFGIVARPYPSNERTAVNNWGAQAAATGAPETDQPVAILKSGFMTVKLRTGTATKGGAVYIRKQNAAAGQKVGGFEAAADGGNTLQLGALPTTYFNGAADADGNVEVAYNI